MSTSIRYSGRLPWSTRQLIPTLEELDGIGHRGAIISRAIGHLLDQPDHVVTHVVTAVGVCRQEQRRDITSVHSFRMDSLTHQRLVQWVRLHPDVPASWLIDAAIRCYLSVCKGLVDNGFRAVVRGANGARRPACDLLVIVDEAHAA